MTHGRELVAGETHAGHMASHVSIFMRGDWCMALEVTYTWHATSMSCGGEMAHGLAIYMDVQFSSRGVPVQFVESSKKERRKEKRGKARRKEEKKIWKKKKEKRKERRK